MKVRIAERRCLLVFCWESKILFTLLLLKFLFGGLELVCFTVLQVFSHKYNKVESRFLYLPYYVTRDR